MSKLNKPQNIIFIGATVYSDMVQRAYLERVYPYVKDAKRVYRFPTYQDETIDLVLKGFHECNEPTALFVLDKYYNDVISKLKKSNLKAIEKDDSIIFTNDSILIVKKVELFNKLPTPITISNRAVGTFKAFGNEKELLKLEDKLQEHAIIRKVLPTWYHIEIQDSIGEDILVTVLKELKNVKLLPISSVRGSLIEYLSQKCKTLTFAESCTGGLLASKFTAISGASKVINGAMVTYSNDIKIKWLNVKKETITKFGAVSKECVSEMLDGISKVANANISIAISGIAGPTGGSNEKPIGTVFIGIKNEDKKEIKKFNFRGDRGFIQEQAARKAIEMIIYSEPDFFEFF